MPMMQQERKQIIQHALGYDIHDIHTYSGYKGDLIVKITTSDKNAVAEIRKFAISLGVEEVVVRQNPSIQEFEIYCVTVDENVYHLKEDEEHEDRDHNNYVEDSWTKSALD
ncbi:hypothetical protein [Sulfurimonas sp. HSL-1716]|uniref:hypothetical protein n=1 Tax=Hydrocurvibacter sulfurireducens TaxID=3131937 RepID=UPI0031F95433